MRPLHKESDVEDRISDGLKAEGKGEAYAFARHNEGRWPWHREHLVPSGGSTTQKKVEIWSTWYTSDTQGTKVNPECKYLLLKHAFEDWRAERLQFTTDANDLRSQHAILKRGAKLEEKLRGDKRRPDGSMRDSMVYSIITSE